MKLLFDQNISFRLISKINNIYPDSKQIRELDLENSSDIEIFNFAKLNQYTIVTFNADFFDLNTLYGVPPKIIWLRTGNTTTANLELLLKRKFDLIKTFIESDFGCLEISE